MNKQDDIYEAVAHELNISEDLVRFVIEDLESSLRIMMRDPQITGPLIEVRNCFKVKLNEKHAKKLLRKGKISEEKQKKLFLLIKHFNL